MFWTIVLAILAALAIVFIGLPVAFFLLYAIFTSGEKPEPPKPIKAREKYVEPPESTEDRQWREAYTGLYLTGERRGSRFTPNWENDRKRWFPSNK